MRDKMLFVTSMSTTSLNSSISSRNRIVLVTTKVDQEVKCREVSMAKPKDTKMMVNKTSEVVKDSNTEVVETTEVVEETSSREVTTKIVVTRVDKVTTTNGSNTTIKAREWVTITITCR